eukprot:9235-Heterococcus_DN1.PRE.2
MSNPERVNDAGLKLRVRHSFTQCLSCFRLHPEIWHDLARFEALMGGDDITIANSVYKQAIEVLPQCELLRIGLADLEESRSNTKAAKQAWKWSSCFGVLVVELNLQLTFLIRPNIWQCECFSCVMMAALAVWKERTTLVAAVAVVSSLLNTDPKVLEHLLRLLYATCARLFAN